MKAAIILCLVTVAFLAFIPVSSGCNEAICASVVSKCMLTQSCKCDLKDCTCCKDCFHCLGYLYSECCSCVDMCPKRNETSNELSKKSYVEELDGVPGLFAALTSQPDQQQRWLSITFPVDFDIAQYSPAKETEANYHLQTVENGVTPQTNIVTLNCTVAYLSQCLSCDKCKTSCQSMGAGSLRWFHDGCCECVGTCVNYGINESRCLACPDGKESDPMDLDDDLSSVDDESLDYGEDGENQEV